MLLSGASGKVIHEKNLKQKISWHCPFKKEKDFFLLFFSWFEDNLVSGFDKKTLKCKGTGGGGVVACFWINVLLCE